jgi:DGQHR domain-containing protein
VAANGSNLQRRALRIHQTDTYPLYLFTLRASEVLEIADVSRVSRDEAGKLIGYQRPEVRSHIKGIVEYLDSELPLFPNPIIMALSSRARFQAIRGQRQPGDELAVSGTLFIPVPVPGKPKPAWIVDGQQRALALSRAKKRDFPVPVTAFAADTVSLQRDQFLRVNTTRPLPRGLVTELLPEVDNPLPPHLAVQKAPSMLCNVLNTDSRSPFHRLIKRVSTSKDQTPRAPVTDTVVVDMIKESLTQTSGCLFPYRNVSSNETDYDAIIHALITYWSAVRDVFPEAWGKTSSQSRLMHSVGIRAMGRLMDRILGNIDPAQPDAPDRIRQHLRIVAPHCRWTAGVWEEFGVRWNALESTPKSTAELSNFLIRVYVQGRTELR